MKTHQDFIQLAIQYAKNSVKRGGYPFGAVVVKDGAVVGDNNFEEPLYNPIAHAETEALINASENLKTDDLSGCVLYSSCKPCKMCLSAIKWSGIKEIYYAFDEDDAKSIGYFEKIFYDENINVIENKIYNHDLLEFMKNWYDKKTDL